MSIASLCILVALGVVLTLAAYMSRVYSEFGKILSREVQDNLDAWEQHVEPRLWMDRERAALSASVLMHLAMGLLALELGAVLFGSNPVLGWPNLEEIAQSVLAVVLVAVFCTQLVPFLLFQRTRGLWVVQLLWPVDAVPGLPGDAVCEFYALDCNAGRRAGDGRGRDGGRCGSAAGGG